jgi:hypothetical protein
MTEWTADDLLRFDIAFALKKVTIPCFRKAMTEEQPSSSISDSAVGNSVSPLPDAREPVRANIWKEARYGAAS